MDTRIDHLTGGIYRISTWAPDYRITFNQFLIDDERPALIHTGEYAAYDQIRRAIAQVLDPKRLAYVALLHWEGDENGGMDRFMRDAPEAELVGSALSIDHDGQVAQRLGRIWFDCQSLAKTLLGRGQVA